MGLSTSSHINYPLISSLLLSLPWRKNLKWLRKERATKPLRGTGWVVPTLLVSLDHRLASRGRPFFCEKVCPLEPWWGDEKESICSGVAEQLPLPVNLFSRFKSWPFQQVCSECYLVTNVRNVFQNCLGKKDFWNPVPFAALGRSLLMNTSRCGTSQDCPFTLVPVIVIGLSFVPKLLAFSIYLRC